ncbi:MAG: hypothetical protein COA79_19030 [Planctomycetota bacterium]|nr:MAG: hypothetical protein COA79_19030 [Planctomycetota bacterium]
MNKFLIILFSFSLFVVINAKEKIPKGFNKYRAKCNNLTFGKNGKQVFIINNVPFPLIKVKLKPISQYKYKIGVEGIGSSYFKIIDIPSVRSKTYTFKRMLNIDTIDSELYASVLYRDHTKKYKYHLLIINLQHGKIVFDKIVKTKRFICEAYLVSNSSKLLLLEVANSSKRKKLGMVKLNIALLNLKTNKIKSILKKVSTVLFEINPNQNEVYCCIDGEKISILNLENEKLENLINGNIKNEKQKIAPFRHMKYDHLRNQLIYFDFIQKGIYAYNFKGKTSKNIFEPIRHKYFYATFFDLKKEEVHVRLVHNRDDLIKLKLKTNE